MFTTIYRDHRRNGYWKSATAILRRLFLRCGYLSLLWRNCRWYARSVFKMLLLSWHLPAKLLKWVESKLILANYHL